MKYPRFFVLVAVLCSVSGCVTPDRPSRPGAVGSFYVERMAENRFVVTFKSNVMIEPARAHDFALLKAAEVTAEYHYTHFTVDREVEISHVPTDDSGSTITTTKRVVPANEGDTGASGTAYSERPAFKPGSKLIIRCFAGPPTDGHAGQVFEAARVVAELKEKYKSN